MPSAAREVSGIAVGALDPGVGPQSHHIAPAGLTAEPGEQLGAGESARGQECDGVERCQKLIGLPQQCDHDLSADAGTGVLQRLPKQWNGSDPAKIKLGAGQRA